jgi:hypothetical protein
MAGVGLTLGIAGGGRGAVGWGGAFNGVGEGAGARVQRVMGP